MADGSALRLECERVDRSADKKGGRMENTKVEKLGASRAPLKVDSKAGD
jgi:hypothetical protein